MTRALILTLLLATLPRGPETAAASGDKAIRHQPGLTTMMLHVTDPDWSDICWRRNGIPQYEVSYGGIGLKGRYFRYGAFRRPYTWNGDGGVLYFIGNEPDDPDHSVKINSAFVRAADIVECLATYRLASLYGIDLQAGIGGSHRKGFEEIIADEDRKYLHLITKSDHYAGWASSAS